MIDSSIFKAYDIRGIYPTQINEECMEDIIRGIYTFLSNSIGKRDITIVIGHDMRLSSPSLHKIAVETLQKLGAQVIDIGLQQHLLFISLLKNIHMMPLFKLVHLITQKSITELKLSVETVPL